MLASTSDSIPLDQKQRLGPRSLSRQSTSSLKSAKDLGSNGSKGYGSVDPKNIISENPEYLESHKRIQSSEVTGNCQPWSDHLFYKMFLDPDGRNATLMVLKCEITYVDVFTDEEHSLYKSRFIGGKEDGVAQMFSFDLMKSRWEEKIPQSHAIELNIDIVMSSSPISQCSETLVNLLQLEKAYLKHMKFDGQLNVMVRFSHSYGWEDKNVAVKERIYKGLRNLRRVGVTLEVMSADFILEEMRVEGILATNDEKIKHYVAKRHAWRDEPTKPSLSPSESLQSTTVKNPDQAAEQNSSSADARPATAQEPDTFSSMVDSYYEILQKHLKNIIQDVAIENDSFEVVELADDEDLDGDESS